jgi:MoxR-like ATPase
MALIEAVRTVHLALTLQGYMVDLAEASRRHPALLLGLSPRATLQLSRATRARAASQGREYATPDDVKAVAEPVLSHRVMLRPDAMSRGVTGITVIREILGSVPVPAGR